MDCHILLQWIFPTQGSNLHLLFLLHSIRLSLLGSLYKVASLGKNKQTGSDVLPPASAWVSFQDIMLSTRSRQEKATPCVSALMWRWNWQTCRQEAGERLERLRGSWGGRKWHLTCTRFLFGWGWCKWESKVKVTQSCPTLCDPMDHTVHGILQARILEWVAFPFSRGSSQPRDQTQVSFTLQADSLLAEPQGRPRKLEWVAYPFSSGSSQPRNWSRVSCIEAGFFTNWAMRELDDGVVEQLCQYTKKKKKKTMKIKNWPEKGILP